MKKTDEVRMAIKNGDMKKALRIAKGFRIGISKEQKDAMTRAYECMIYPSFYVQLGFDIKDVIEKGYKTVVSLYGEA